MAATISNEPTKAPPTQPYELIKQINYFLFKDTVME